VSESERESERAKEREGVCVTERERKRERKREGASHLILQIGLLIFVVLFNNRVVQRRAICGVGTTGYEPFERARERGRHTLDLPLPGGAAATESNAVHQIGSCIYMVLIKLLPVHR